MFSQMRIRGVGVIDDAVLDLSPGLNVLTGETGAGKTMVVSGLGLLLGERADSGLVRTGSSSALVEGVVQLPLDHPALVRADEAGADHEDGELVIARTIAAAGRSRAHVGGRTAPVVGARRARPDARGRARTGRPVAAQAGRRPPGGPRRLRRPDLAALRDRVAELYDRWRESAREHARLVSEARERAREIDSLTASLEEIEAVDPQPGEDAALRAEDERLAHADTLRLAAAQALADLSGDEYAAEPAPNVRDLIGSARGALTPATAHDQALAGLDERLHEVGTLVTDLAADLTAYLQDVDLDPERLGYVQERRAALGVLTRKYGETVDEVLAWSGRGAARLDELVTADDRVERLGAEVAELEASVVGAALALSDARRAAGDDFGIRVSEELAHLAMGKAVVHVELRRRDRPRRRRAARRRAGPALAARHRRRRDPARGQPGCHAAQRGPRGVRRRAVAGHARARGRGLGAARRVRRPVVRPRSSSTRSTRESAAVPRSTSGRVSPPSPSTPRSSSSPTSHRWRRSPTGTSSCTRPTTDASPRAASRSWRETPGCASSRG